MRAFFILRPTHLLAGALLALASAGRPAAAQLLVPTVPARPYDYLTLTLVESSAKSLAKLLLAPAFNGRTEIQLEPIAAFLPASRLEQLRRNDEVLTQSLGELSAAGWELVQVTPSTLGSDRDVQLTRYLLRRARP